MSRDHRSGYLSSEAWHKHCCSQKGDMAASRCCNKYKVLLVTPESSMSRIIWTPQCIAAGVYDFVAWCSFRSRCPHDRCDIPKNIEQLMTSSPPSLPSGKSLRPERGALTNSNDNHALGSAPVHGIIRSKSVPQAGPRNAGSGRVGGTQHLDGR